MNQFVFREKTALDFVASVRQTQQSYMKALQGARKVSQSVTDCLHAASFEICGASVASDFRRCSVELGQRFAEMCRRQDVDVDLVLWPSLLKVMAGELEDNKEASGLAYDKLLPVTLYQGAIVRSLVNERPDDLWTVKRAITNAAFNPRRLLKQVDAAMAEIPEDKAFVAFHDTPWIIKHAAVFHSQDPRRFLREVEEKANRIAAMDAFSTLESAPGVIRDAVVRHPRDPQAFLQKVVEQTAEIAQEKEFRAVAPGRILRAVAQSPNRAREYLGKNASFAV